MKQKKPQLRSFEKAGLVFKGFESTSKGIVVHYQEGKFVKYAGIKDNFTFSVRQINEMEKLRSEIFRAAPKDKERFQPVLWIARINNDEYKFKPMCTIGVQTFHIGRECETFAEAKWYLNVTATAFLNYHSCRSSAIKINTAPRKLFSTKKP